jgi:protein SCO1/2
MRWPDACAPGITSARQGPGAPGGHAPGASFVRLTAGAALALVALGGMAQAGPPADVRRAYETSQAAIGNAIGEYALRDTAGRTVRLSDYRGKPLLVSFVYTGCFQVCPTATRFLADATAVARRALGEDRFHVVSIGFNQPFDDPAAMASFARQAGIRDERWSFLSPRQEDVEPLTRLFGFNYEASTGGFDHLLQVSIVDARGVLYRQVYGEGFEMPMLVQPLKELLSGEAAREFTLANVWDKVVLYCTVYDPHSGGYRVNYSLFFEIFAGLTTLAAIAWMVLRELRRARRT